MKFIVTRLIPLVAMFAATAADDLGDWGQVRRLDGVPRLFLNNTAVPPVFPPAATLDDSMNDASKRRPPVLFRIPVALTVGDDNGSIQSALKSIFTAAAAHPDARFILDARIAVTPEWLDDHPAAVVANQRGDSHQTQTNNGNTAGPFASCLSPLFTIQAQATLRSFLDQSRKLPAHKSVVGVFLGGGTGVKFLFNLDGDQWIDYGPAAVAAFRDAMKAKYGDEDALRKALDDDRASFAAVTPPPRGERTAGVFRDPKRDRLIADFSEFLSTRAADALTTLARTVKENAGKPVIVGVRYDPILFGIKQNNAALGRLLRSPFVDAVVIPRAKDDSGPYQLASARRHGVIWTREMASIDFPANVDPAAAIIGAGGICWTPTSSDESAANATTAKEIDEFIGLYDSVGRRRNGFKPDVALVIDEESLHWVSENPTVVATIDAGVRKTVPALAAAGVPFDVFTLDDLSEFEDLADYRLFIFPNCFMLDQDERGVIGKRLKKSGKILVWMGAPGFLRPEGASLDNVFNACGFKMRTSPGLVEMTVKPIPRTELTMNASPEPLATTTFQKFQIDPGENIIPFAEFAADETVAGAMKHYLDWTSVCVTVPGALTPSILNDLAVMAGVHHAPGVETSMEVGDGLLAVENASGKTLAVPLPRPCRLIKDAFTGETVKGGAAESPATTIEIPSSPTPTWMILVGGERN